MLSAEKIDLEGSDEVPPGLTLRAFLVGALLSLLMSIEITYGEKIILSTHMDMHFFSGSAALFLLILVGIVNLILKAIHRRWALKRSELLTVYIMMVVGSSVPRIICYNLLPLLGAPLYYATPENEWSELIQPYIQPWLVPQDFSAIKYLYEGLPAGEAIPWGAWVRPLFFWFLFLAALYLVMISVMVVLRRQWAEHERLIYPLVQLPLAMVEEGGRGIIGPFFKDRVMWLGFSIPFIVGCIRSLHNYYPFLFPPAELTHSIWVFRRTEDVRFLLSFYEIGFFYFVDLSISFSLWFFYLLVLAQAGTFNILNLGSTEASFGNYSLHPFIAHQGIGAIIVLTLFALWVGRTHLKDVFRRVFRQAPYDDSGEMLSYRWAFLCLIVGLFLMGWALWVSGLPFWVVPLFLLGALVLFIAVTRIVVEGGVNRARSPLSTPGLVVAGVGSSRFSQSGVVALAFTFGWAADLRTFVMASVAHGLKLADGIGERKRLLFPAIWIGIVLCFLGSVWVMLKYGYKLGGVNLYGWQRRGPFDEIARLIRNPVGVHWGGWVATGIGGAIMFLLMIARQRFLWWPLHPLGFPLATVDMMKWSWFSAFLAWMLKAVILKYGGPKLFMRLRPFFLGLILGTFVVSGVWLVIDIFTGMIHNDIYFLHG